MGVLLTKLEKLGILISDGAWGTMLQSNGMTTDDCPEEWNVSHPDAVCAIAKAYADAGSDMSLTNTFGGSRIKLDKKGYADRVAEFNEAGAKNSLGVGGSAIIAGSVGPTGEFIEPLGAITAEEMEEVFAEQIAALLKGGVRVICVETMMAVEEAVCAVTAAKKLDPTVDVIATMTFDKTPNGFRTMMGVDPQRAADELSAAGADVLGSNCGNGIEGMIEVAGEFRKHTSKPILIHANAGVPELVGGQTVFRQSPEDFAANTQALVDAGANIIGGCCGTTPQHIAAMKAAVGK
ncbi:MAG: homocysteine S-methyltransferase family protein [Phycisphaerae bacterium]|nr:homocysteine S-methyltransferase family protein [Phycisphaerae bacterium]